MKREALGCFFVFQGRQSQRQSKHLREDGDGAMEMGATTPAHLSRGVDSVPVSQRKQLRPEPTSTGGPQMLPSPAPRGWSRGGRGAVPEPGLDAAKVPPVRQ